VWNTHAALARDGSAAEEQRRFARAGADLVLERGTRWPRTVSVRVPGDDAPGFTVHYEPVVRFPMRGIGYFHPHWAHGRYHGELEVEREDRALDEVDPLSPAELHVQAASRVRLEPDDGPVRDGVGVFESLIIGPYEPLGLTDAFGPAW
jgi:hypothetical protein